MTQSTQADFRNIPWGSFTFQVRAIGQSNKWGPIFEYEFEVFRKIEIGKLKLDLIQGDIVLYLQYIIDSFKALAKFKGINLHFVPLEQTFYYSTRENSIVVS